MATNTILKRIVSVLNGEYDIAPDQRIGPALRGHLFP